MPKNASRPITSFDYGVPWSDLVVDPITREVTSKPLSSLNRLALCRNIQYIVHHKLYSTSGRQSPTALKSHSFCVPHRGADVIANHIAVNPGCLAAFTVTFFGSSSAFQTLRALPDGLPMCSVDPKRSLDWLRYVKGAGNPHYVDLELPDEAQLTLELHDIRRRAIAAAECNDEAINRVMEHQSA